MARILVVDDVPDNVKLLRYDLADQEHDVLTALSGREALGIASAECPDLILLDVMMPDMDGIEVCRRLKEDARTRTIPVILVTAKGLDENVVSGLDAGADDYISKPYSSEVLVARVRSALRVKESYEAVTRTNELLCEEIAFRKRVEEQLRKSEAKFRVLYDSSGDAMMLLDKRGFFSCNDAALRMFRYEDREELCSKHPAELSPPTQPGGSDSLSLTNERIAAAMRDESSRFEWLHRRSDGTDFPAEVLLSPMDLDGRRVLQAVVRDITARKQAEDDLRESRNRFERVAMSVSDLIYEWDVTTDRLDWLGDIDGALGYPQGTIPPTIEDWLALVHPEDHAKIADAVEHHRQTAEPINVTYRIQHSSGEWRHWENRGSAILDDAGSPACVIGACSDVTERNRLQNKLVETSRLAGMADVATGVLHNVGNVLNSVNVSGQLVAEKVKNSRVTGLAKANALIEQHADDLAMFITGDEKGKLLPDYLRGLSTQLHAERDFVLEEIGGLMESVEHIKQIVSMQQSFASTSGVTMPVSLTDLVEDALKTNDASFLKHDVELLREYEELPQVTTDRHKVLQILVNLIGNAKQALAASHSNEKRLTLRVVRSCEDRVAVEVEDNGVGISSKDLSRIFQHGFTTKKHGHGFGLHSSALAAKELGGTLSVRSEGLGQGATFKLELPLNLPANKASAGRERPVSLIDHSEAVLGAQST